MTNKPVGIFIFGGPGSGKDYVLKNIFSRFDLTEVQADQIVLGSAKSLIENRNNIVINCTSECEEKIQLIKVMLEGYAFDHVYVSVNNKVSRERNQQRKNPLREDVRIRKMLIAKNVSENLDDVFTFNNNINLNESTEIERMLFASSIHKLLERIISHGLEMSDSSNPKNFSQFNEDLRKWFKQKWVRMDTKGNIKGECARGEGEGKPKCLPIAKAKSMSKIERKKAVLRKRRQDPVAEREGKGNKPVFVATEEVLLEKNIPTNPELWSRAKALAKKKFDVYPSAYANGWASKWYKGKGGGWKTDVSEAFEDGTDAYRKHAINMTPGQGEIKNAKETMELPIRKKENSSGRGTSGSCGCSGSGASKSTSGGCGCGKTIREARAAEEAPEVNFNPQAGKTTSRKVKGKVAPTQDYNAVVGSTQLVSTPPVNVSEAVEYHVKNNISLTENIFRPGSDMFFNMINEAKKQFANGTYEPTDLYEQEMLESDIGEFVMVNGKKIPLDFPFMELEEEGDKTNGHGVGKPFRKNGGGAVYVRTGEGKVRLVNFSQSGMSKKFNNPARLKSFMARHKCLTNKDKTSASYWACRYPRFFSNSGQRWW